jgi:thiamine-monophosphate kinase
VRLRSLRERELVAAIRREFGRPARGVRLGIGDDAAVIRPGRGDFLLTTDLLIEDVHFTTAIHPPFLLGRKSLNVNVSDIAAMGGRPRFALLGLGLKPGLAGEWAEAFFSGFKAAAGEAGVTLVGGDISAAKKICVSVTLAGDAARSVRRSGARPGDLIFVSGDLGQAAAGLRLLKRGLRLGGDQKAEPLIRAFLDPVPRVRLGRELARKRLASAMIDTSDGLSVDLLHLCQESRCGADIALRALPISPELRSFVRKPEDLALHGGEDYQLLFAVPPGKLPEVSRLKTRHGLRQIGIFRRGRGITVVDRRGERRPLEPRGFEHLA